AAATGATTPCRAPAPGPPRSSRAGSWCRRRCPSGADAHARARRERADFSHENACQDAGMERKRLILIVEDEKEIAKFIDLELQAENYDTVVSYDGVTGLSKFRELNPDLVVLDLMLPVLDGLEVARRIRKTSNTPIIILTAKRSEEHTSELQSR